jgi:hypothetical protein
MKIFGLENAQNIPIDTPQTSQNLPELVKS